jgi:predicted ribosome quality control (RQC) complex YloA/Tae2 family protein
MKMKTVVIQSSPKEITFLVGTCAQDNFDAIDISDPDDIWFHVRDGSSCHVIAKMPAGEKMDKKIIHKIIKQGALLCKQESRYKSSKNLAIIYTKVQNVHKTNIVGSVIADPVSTICI